MTHVRHDYIQTHVQVVDQLDIQEEEKTWEQLKREAAKEFREEGIPFDQVLLEKHVDMRYSGQEHTVKVPIKQKESLIHHQDDIVERFHVQHEQHYTFRLDDTLTEVVNFHLTAKSKQESPELKQIEIVSSLDEAFLNQREVYFDEKGWINVDVYQKDLIPPLQEIKGPVIIEEQSTTVLLEEGQKAMIDEFGNLIIELGEEMDDE
nr:hypothetical protein [Halobacillus shinanisalinarum]